MSCGQGQRCPRALTAATPALATHPSDTSKPLPSKIFSVLPAHPQTPRCCQRSGVPAQLGKMLRSPGHSSCPCPPEHPAGKHRTAPSSFARLCFSRPRAGRGDRRGGAARCPHGAPPAPPLTATAPGPARAAPPPANGHSAAAPANQRAPLCPPSLAIGWLSHPASAHWLLPVSRKQRAPPPCLPQLRGSSSGRDGPAPFL